MKLHWSPRSPFVRKVMVALHELGMTERVRTVRSVAAATAANPDIQVDNPLSKIPTLVLDDGAPLYDSSVICQYLDSLGEAPRLVPATGPQRWTVLRREALADGFLDFLLVWRQELNKPQPQRSPPHLAAFENKFSAVLARLEDEVEAFASEPLHLGQIATACALSYLDFRFADRGWRAGRPRLAAWHGGFAQRPSMQATEVVDDS